MHVDSFSDELSAVFDEGAMVDVSFVLVLDCKASLPGLDEERFDQLFETVLETTDAVRTGCGEGRMFMGGGRV
jgi:hypothetical protein